MAEQRQTWPLRILRPLGVPVNINFTLIALPAFLIAEIYPPWEANLSALYSVASVLPILYLIAGIIGSALIGLFIDETSYWGCLFHKAVRGSARIVLYLLGPIFGILVAALALQILHAQVCGGDFAAVWVSLFSCITLFLFGYLLVQIVQSEW